MIISNKKDVIASVQMIDYKSNGEAFKTHVHILISKIATRRIIINTDGW